MYTKPPTMYTQEAFWDFNALVEVQHDAIFMNYLPMNLI
jgi:hypothetical protein